MALDHTIILGRFLGAAGNGSYMKVQQGASVLVPVSQQYNSNPGLSASYDYAKLGFTFDGRLYLPCGSRGSNGQYGWVSYHQELDEFFQSTSREVVNRMIPFFDKLLFWDWQYQGYGTSPWHHTYETSNLNAYARDYAIGADTVHILYPNSTVYHWQYPFNASPTSHALPGTGGDYLRICELDDDIYFLSVQNGAAGTLQLVKLVLGVPTLVGAGTTVTIWGIIKPTSVALFKFNGKLFCAICETSGSGQNVRLFEIDTTTGVFTERNSWLPAAWQAASADSFQRIFEIRDDISNTEQVFLCRCGGTATTGWEIYEFAEGPFSLVHAGTDIIHPYCGVIYDPDTRAAQFKSAADSVPSSYITAEIETYDLANNAVSDIDPRYRNAGAEPPPYSVCTEKAGVGSEGVTGLSTIPAGITTLVDTSDDFGDASIDEDLWEIVNPSLYYLNRDYGFAMEYRTVPNTGKPAIVESGGAIQFGDGTAPGASPIGVGLKSKWWMEDAFSIRFTLSNLAQLRDAAGTQYAVIALVKVNTEQFYGFIVWRNGGVNYVRSFYCAIDSNPVQGGDAVYNPVDGDVIEVSRDGADNWSIIVDPDTTAEDITPAGVSYDGPANIVIGGYTNAAIDFATGTPGPGFSDIAVSGAGFLGRYEGGVKHTFAWDHITDLGAGVTTDVQLFVDVQRT